MLSVADHSLKASSPSKKIIWMVSSRPWKCFMNTNVSRSLLQENFFNPVNCHSTNRKKKLSKQIFEDLRTDQKSWWIWKCLARFAAVKYRIAKNHPPSTCTDLGLIQIHLHGVRQVDHLRAWNGGISCAQKSCWRRFAVVVTGQDQSPWRVWV